MDRDRANAAVTWNYRQFSTTVYEDCHGTSRGLVVSFNIDNVFNRQQPFDPTDTGLDDQPHNSANYNGYGRSHFNGASYRFGR